MHRIHIDNNDFRYFAQDSAANVRSMMYISPFVYQFFIYNSLYQIDWPTSLLSGKIQEFQSKADDVNQAAFENYVFDRLRSMQEAKRINAIGRAFMEIEAKPVNTNWATVIPDARISVENGRKYFNNLRNFKNSLRQLRNTNNPDIIPRIFTYVTELRIFVYDVRCNIFHGRKSLKDAAEPNQDKRIELYYLFLRGLVTLFFVTMDNSK